MIFTSRFADLFLLLTLLGGCGQGAILATPDTDKGTTDSGIDIDSGSIDQRKVDCTGDCTFAATYTVSTDGFFALHRDRAILSPPQGYQHRYGTPQLDGGSLESAPTLPTCTEQGPVSACDMSQDLADPEVQQALAQATVPFFGCDCRGGDANVFSFIRDDGHGFLVGRPDTTTTNCPRNSCRVTIPIIPLGISRLMTDLYALDAAVILSPECLNLNVRLQVAGSTSLGSG